MNGNSNFSREAGTVHTNSRQGGRRYACSYTYGALISGTSLYSTSVVDSVGSLVNGLVV